MELIKVFTRANCPINMHGLKRIIMDYYFCKDCDKEEKFPMCAYCVKHCHHNHSASQKHKGKPTDLQRCSCGLSNHQAVQKELTSGLNICHFSDLSKANKILNCYQNSREHKICEFCRNFCYQDSINDEEEFKLNFVKVKLDENNFSCQCPLYKNSKHTAADYMTKYLKEINISNLFYFPSMSPVILLNAYFSSNELFSSVNQKFVDTILQILNDNNNAFNPNDMLNENASVKTSNSVVTQQTKISPLLTQTYVIFHDNAKNCKNDWNLYFCNELEFYFQNKLLDIFFGPFEAHAKRTLQSGENNFYENFLYGYKIFNVESTFSKLGLPKYKLLDFINLNPYQRLLLMKTAKENSYEVDFIFRLAKALIKESSIISDTRILIEVLNIIKTYAKHYLLTADLTDFLKVLEIFFINFDNLKDEKMDFALTQKILKTVAKIIIYIAFYCNDQAILNNVKSSLVKTSIFKEEKVLQDKEHFIYSDGELQRALAKIAIYIVRFFEIGKSSTKSSELLQIIMNIGLGKHDAYSPGIKRLITPGSENLLKFILKDKSEATQIKAELISRIHQVSQEENAVNQRAYEYYTLIDKERDIGNIVKVFEGSLERVMKILSINPRNSSEGNRISNASDENKPTQNDGIFASGKKSVKSPLIDGESKDMTESKHYMSKSNLMKPPANIIPHHSNINSTDKINVTIENDNNKSYDNIPSQIISTKQMLIDNDIDNNESYTSLHDINNMNSSLKGVSSETQSENSELEVFDFTYYLPTITKIFPMCKDKEIFSPKFCYRVLSLLSAYVMGNSNHAIFVFSSQIIHNLSEIPILYMPKLFSFFKQGVKTIAKNKDEVGSIMHILYLIYRVFQEKVPTYKEQIYGVCLVKLLEIISLLYEAAPKHKLELVNFIKEEIFASLEISKIFNTYVKFLVSIAEDFKINPNSYKEKKHFYNESIFRRHFKNENPKVYYKIFLHLVNILTSFFDGEAVSTKIEFIQNLITAKQISLILSTTTLTIRLRIELVKIFRMAYIDTIINEKKLNLYRVEFRADLEKKIKPNLFSNQQNKIFKFYELLMNVNSDSKTMSDEEYECLLFEMENFTEIVEFSDLALDSFDNEAKNLIFMEYFQDALIQPLVIYLNKVFSVISSYNDEQMEKIFALTKQTLETVKQYNTITLDMPTIREEPESNDEQTLKFKKKNSISKLSKTITQFNDQDAIDKDLKLLSEINCSSKQYYTIFQVLARHLMMLFENPKINKPVIYFADFKLEEENNISSFKNDLLAKGIPINTNEYLKRVLEQYQLYVDGKYTYENHSFHTVLNLPYTGAEGSFRGVLCKYLLNMLTYDLDIYEKDTLSVLLNMLMDETSQTQTSIMELINNNHFKKFDMIIEKCYLNILSTMLSQFNPVLIKYNENYYSSCAMIKLFKFLCEEHNPFFQKFLLNKFLFTLDNIQLVTFYDMMLHILEKIIVLSCWEQVKTPDDFHNYFVHLFSCITELLIEVIQGTADSNFLSLIDEQFDENNPLKVTKMDPALKKGKAFNSFLQCVRNLIGNDEQNSEELDSIRKSLMEYILTFIEEYNCPMEIKSMIIINFHPGNIIKSIGTVLKKNYWKRIQSDVESIRSGEMEIESEKEMKLKRRRTMILIDSQETKKRKKNKMSKKIYFNKNIYLYFRKLYFTNEEFSESSSVGLCCLLYNFFKLTLKQCKENEAMTFWKKIHSIKQEHIESFDMETEKEIFTSDEADYEAYYIFKLFEQISREVLVKIKEDKPPVYIIYTIPPCLNYLSPQTKRNFLSNVDRSSRNTKLFGLMEQIEFFQIEAEYNYDKLRHKPFLKFLTTINYYNISIIFFVVDLGLNIWMLAIAGESGNSFKVDSTIYMTLTSITIVFCVIVFAIIVIWCYTKMQLYLKIEQTKYLKSHRIENSDKLRGWDKFVINLNAFFYKGELASLIFFFIFKVIGSVNEELTFFYSFSLLSIMFLNKNLSDLCLSFYNKGSQLLWVTSFTLVVLHVWGGWAYYFLRDLFYDDVNRDEKPVNMCDSLFYCFLTQINNGFRWYPGISKLMRIISAILHPLEFFHHFIYHFLFYLIVRIMLLKIVFGIILDSFGEQRELRNSIEKDVKFKCFICDIEKDECEKRNKDFNEHRELVHNIWDYANYMIMLRMADFQDLNGTNSMCKEMIQNLQMNWIPDSENIEDQDF